MKSLFESKIVADYHRRESAVRAGDPDAEDASDRTEIQTFSKARLDDSVQPDLPRASFISYLTALNKNQ